MTRPLPCALVLTAGLGTRLRPLTWVRAKPAAPVAGRTLVVRVLEWLAAHGVADAVLNLHALPATITREVGHGEALGLRVRYSWEPVILGSAGGPRLALPLIGTDPFLIVNGDTLTDLDLAGLVIAHEASDALVTMAVIPNPRPDRYGGVLVGGDGRVEGFTRAGDPRPSYLFPGVQVANQAVFADLPAGEPAESVSGRYRDLLRTRPGAVRAWVTQAAFDDIGTPADYLRTSWTLAAREGLDAGPLVGAGVEIAPTAHLGRTVLWDDIEIGADCRLTECIVADGVRLPCGFRADRQVIVPASVVPAGTAGVRDGDLFLTPCALPDANAGSAFSTTPR
ncbi:MAG: NDP-sugar synthase [Acidobacteria bacterium]|nr:NDP-sugar synthase [Acidobacteriota bacterium]